MKQADIKKLGRYDIVGELGKGAMGVVYKGFDPGIERHVALKTVRQDLMMEEDPDATRTQIARFKREAQAAGRMTHPNIVAIYEYGEDGDTAYIAMEFIEGRSLKDYFDAHERFDVKTISRLMGEMLGALDYSHRHGIVHRDIKPANIMMTKAAEVKITDFGIARVESSSLTQAGAVLGTPSYMSPEQFMGQQVDARSDIFSAGGVLYQLLTGEKPFTGSLTTIMHRVLHGQPEPPSVLNVQIPKGFDAVVAKAMAKRPDERYQSAAAFAEAIRAAAEGRLAPPPPPPADAEETFDGTVMDIGAPPAPPAPAPTAAPAAPAEDELPAHALMGDSVPRRSASPTAASTAPVPSSSPSSPPPRPPLDDEEPASAGGKGKIIAIAAAVLLAVGGGAGWMVLGGGGKSDGGGKPVPVAEHPTRPAPAPSVPSAESAAADLEARQREAEERIRRDAENRARAQQQREAEERTRQQQALLQQQQETEERTRAQQQQQQQQQLRAAAEERARQEALQAQQQQQREAEEKVRVQQQALLQQQQKEAEERSRQEALQMQQQKEAEEKARQQQMQMAMAGAALGQMRSAFARLNCALLKAESQPDGSVLLSGIAGDPAAETQARGILEAALPGVRYTSRVDAANRSMCDPLAAMARSRERNQDQSRPVSLRPGSPGAVFRDGQNLVFDVDAPAFAAYLQVDYFTLDGSVVHLFPNGLEKDNRLAANGERRLGDSAGGRTWKVGQPFGRELITVIASSKPLFAQPRPEAEGTAAYLADLRKALDAAVKGAGGTPAPVAAGMFITTQAN